MDDHVVRKIEASQVVIHKNATAARIQATADLRVHLGKFINRANTSDLEFVCKEGVKVEACRMLLIGRSPVLDSMLTNGMLESNSSIINLPEVAAPALLAILEFLYTGDIVEYQPGGWQMGWEIISLAHFLLLPTVDEIVEEFIMPEIPSVQSGLMGDEFQKAAIMLSEATAFKCFADDKNTILLQLLSLLESKWQQPDCLCHLSEEALDFILKHTKPFKTEDRLDTSLEEYLRFRAVLVWCTCNSRSVSEEMNKLLLVALPVERQSLYSKGDKDLSSMEVVWLPRYGGDQAQGEILQILQSKGALDSAIRLLAHIDWKRVPPTIFVKIVEPMKLVPESRLLDIFRFHSLHRVMPMVLSWAHNESHIVHDGGLIIHKNGSSPGSAVCQLESRAGEDLYIWRVIVRNVNSSFCQLGFVCSEGGENPCRTWNLDANWADALRGSKATVSRVIQWRTNAGTLYFDGHGGGYKRQTESMHSVEKIEFQYSRSKQICVITVDDRQLGTVWTGLPSTSVYPLVSLGDNCRAWVRLEIVTGFEIF